MSLFERVGFFPRSVISKLRYLQVSSEKISDGKMNIPSPPKRPLTAFLLFCKDNRQLIPKSNNMTGPQQTKILAEKWSSLNADAKKVYQDVAREDTIAYGQLHKDFYENLTENQKQELIRQKAERKESRKNFRLKREVRESGVPKSPCSAYALYVQSQAKEKGFSVFSEFIKETSSNWRNLQETEKQLYVDRAKEDKKQYIIDMENWRQKLLQSGKQDVLEAFDAMKRKGDSAKSSETVQRGDKEAVSEKKAKSKAEKGNDSVGG